MTSISKLHEATRLSCLLVTALLTASLSYATSGLSISQQVWLEFSHSEKATILSQFPDIEIVPSESVGIIQSVQAVNRSTAGTNGGAMLGGALGQSMYIDQAFKGNGSNYSATKQLGAALIGGAIGATLDNPGYTQFVFNYAIKTLDGQIRELRVSAVDEFTRPVGQCVFSPSISVAPASLCTMDKVQFLKKLSAIGQAPRGAILSQEASGINVNCRVPGVGLMRLERAICSQMEGSIEK